MPDRDSGQALAIEPIRPGDAGEWRRLWSGYLEFYGTRVTEEVYSTTFSRLLSANPGEFEGLIARIRKEPAGLVHFLSHRHCWRIENVVYLQDLYVAPQWPATVSAGL